jgi:hypothetical protein
MSWRLRITMGTNIPIRTCASGFSTTRPAPSPLQFRRWRPGRGSGNTDGSLLRFLSLPLPFPSDLPALLRVPNFELELVRPV